jgi:Cd2+/Zn2+-exporting ATPase
MEFIKKYRWPFLSFSLLMIGLLFDQIVKPVFFTGSFRLGWYLIVYAITGWPVALQGFKLVLKGNVFTEFFLMTIASAGAFFLGEYPEGAAVMLFYTIGELFQGAAVGKARNNIKALLDQRPLIATVWREGKLEQVKPEDVFVGERILVKAGENVPLDGKLISELAYVNNSALTGESVPKKINQGELIWAASINTDRAIELEVTKKYSDSSLNRILTLVQEAVTRKAPTELFIRKFAKIYTPAVVASATLLIFLPYLVLSDYVFRDWLYRGLLFLVASCPCALVISIPLGYFGGIGAASRNGILFKGSNYLDLITKVNTVVFDKTGTLTKGIFKVTKVVSPEIEKSEFIRLMVAIENHSTHPVARAIVQMLDDKNASYRIVDVKEYAGEGIQARMNADEIVVGNQKLLKRLAIAVAPDWQNEIETTVFMAINGIAKGYVTISDEIKPDSKAAIESLHKKNINTWMLSGDKNTIVQKVGAALSIGESIGDLLPEQKMQKLDSLKSKKVNIVAFVGDGINDAPALAISDVGIAMGGLGSDAAIETADVVIQTDQPSKITTAIEIGGATEKIVWQNIFFAFGVKLIVLSLGAGGIATMWEAVFADVGVALIAILNAIRLQNMKF